MNNERIAIITSGYFPVPATLGGAVETLDENLIKQNEIERRVKFEIFSCYDSKAKEIAAKYKNTTINFIKTPLFVKCTDRVIYFIAKNILKKKKNLSYRFIMQRLHFLWKVARNLHDKDYDKVMLENHSTLFLVLRFYHNYKKYKGRYYYHLHNVVTNDYGCRRIISNCAKVIGVSNYINMTLKDFLGEDDNNQYCVLRNKIDRDKFLITLTTDEKKTIRNRLGLKETDKIVLFTGRFSEDKGIRELLTAFKRIGDPDIKLLVAGGYYFGSGLKSLFEEEMKELVAEMKDRVIFTGYIRYEEIPNLYAIADLIVVPSMWDDPAPLTVIESLTAGKALITTDSGGIPEYAEDMAIILKRKDQIIENLTESIEKILSDKKIKKAMEEKALLGTQNWTIREYYNDFCYNLR